MLHVNTIEGQLTAKDKRIALVASRFNSIFSEKLVSGAVDFILRHGGDRENVTLVMVPGAFELPLAAKKLAESGRYHGVICLGVVIRGATPHFDYVCAEASKGIAQVMMDTGIPVGFGVLTTDSVEQAIERSGSKAGNKGAEAAAAVLEMIDVNAQL